LFFSAELAEMLLRKGIVDEKMMRTLNGIKFREQAGTANTL
jgi:hypothetical protein